MLSTIAARSVRMTRVAPKGFAMRGLSTIGNFKSKEKVEEERYVKEQEKAFFHKKKAEAASKLKAEELKHFEDVIAPAMAQLESELKKTGDKVSDAGLEAIARWKTA